jgi:hypothetical protein
LAGYDQGSYANPIYIFACFINLNATQNSYKKYKKFMNSKLPKPTQISDSVSEKEPTTGLY